MNAAQNADALKENSAYLRPRGPVVDVLFEEAGSLGMHIVNITCKIAGTEEEEQREFSRVIVACTVPNSPAFNRVFYGDQVVQVAGANCIGLQLKEVKLMLADAGRPVMITVQPLCIFPTRHEDFPLCPPIPEGSTWSQRVWSIVSRRQALEYTAPARRITAQVEFVTLDKLRYFVKSTIDGVVEEGEELVECDNSKYLALALANNPREFLVRPVQVVQHTACPKCKALQWIFSRYCGACGHVMGKRR